MFDWWDTRTSIAIVCVLFAVRFIGQPAWDKYVGWHLRARQHFWCLPLFAVSAFAVVGVALLAQQTRLGEVLFLLLLSAGGLLRLLVGARCPECSLRMQYRPGRYGPVTYRCRQCGFGWTGWPLKDSLPD